MIHPKYMLIARFLVAMPAQAAYAPPEPVINKDSTIIVTGQKETREETRRKASTFVRTATVVPQEDQYARRRDPLCAAISGIDPKYAVLVGAKITSTAEAVGMKIAKPGCRANLLIHFTNDSNDYIDKISEKRPSLLRTMRPDERLTLEESPSPVRWLYATEARGTDNLPLLQTQRNSSILQSDSVEPVNIPTNRGSLSTYSASLIDTQMIVNLTNTIVIVDAEKSTGFALDSVAAYAAMVSLAQIKLGTDYSSYPSILSMFSSRKSVDQAPRDLTEWDYAYLRALYKIPSNRTARAQRTQIYDEMVNQLAK